jgi:hypothetical protein
MSLDPNVSTEINHALPLRHCGAKSTESTLWQRTEDWCHTVKRRGWENQEDKLGLTAVLLQGLYTAANESLLICTVGTYDSCADTS